MAVLINMSLEAERLLKAEWGDLSQAAREALAIESYRQGKLSVGQCAEVLGLSFAQTEVFLRSRGVDLAMTIDDLRSDQEGLKRILDLPEQPSDDE
jgi:predicted HTH domain antitoxin